MKVLLFGGTSEGRELAEWLDARGRCEVVACSATEYGGELVSGLVHVHPVVGPLDDRAKDELVAEHGFDCIVDATHPYATHVTESIERLARRHGIPLLRVAREDCGEGAFTLVEDAVAAACYIASRPGNVLLTTGTRDLETFVRAVPDFGERLFARVLPVPDSIARARGLGLPASHVVAMQGPFSAAFNCALLRELSIDVMVTKASGAVGGFPEKLDAARSCGVEAVVIGRPTAVDGLALADVKRELEVRYGA